MKRGVNSHHAAIRSLVRAALRVAFTIARCPLVRTALRVAADRSAAVRFLAARRVWLDSATAEALAVPSRFNARWCARERLSETGS